MLENRVAFWLRLAQKGEHLACHLMLLHFLAANVEMNSSSSRIPLIIVEQQVSTSNTTPSASPSNWQTHPSLPSGFEHHIHCEGVNEVTKAHYS